MTARTVKAELAAARARDLAASDLVTAVTRAATDADARAIMAGVRARALLETTADLIYIDPARSSANLRIAIVKEARS